MADRLRHLGHDAIHVLIENQGKSDEDQADLALATDRILVTADYDFGELAMAKGKPFTALVIIAPRQKGLRQVAQELADQIHALGNELLGHLTLIEPERIRRRPLKS